MLADAGIPAIGTDRIMEYMDMSAHLDDTAYPERRLDPQVWRRAHARGLDESRREGMERGLERGMERGMERGLEQGLETGVERGRADGRRALMSLVERFLPAEVDELGTIEDLEELQAQVDARLARRLNR